VIRLRLLSALPVLVLALACEGPPVPDEAVTLWQAEDAGAVTMVGVSVNLAELTADGAGRSQIAKPFDAVVKEQTWIELLEFNWNPNGHGPPGVNDVPHVDVHFYGISNEERLAIRCEDQPFPPAEQVPEGVVVESTAAEPFGPCVNEMGVHAYDPSTGHYDENGQLDHDMIYGYSDGALVFVEPMIHRHNYEDGVPLELDIPTPQTLDAPTRFPTRFVGQLSEDGATYEFALTDFVDLE